MENTLENKAKFFAQYWGQLIVKFNEETKQKGVFVLDELKIQKEIIEHTYLELKPLSSISDEDAIEMANKFGSIEVDENTILNRPTDLGNDDIHFVVQVYNKTPEYKSFSTPKYLTNNFSYVQYQWLQSKGYALDWNGTTVEQQIEYGWIKLK